MDGNEHNFDKSEDVGVKEFVSYDYHSIMHYGPRDFSKDGVLQTIGQWQKNNSTYMQHSTSALDSLNWWKS